MTEGDLTPGIGELISRAQKAAANIAEEPKIENPSSTLPPEIEVLTRRLQLKTGLEKKVEQHDRSPSLLAIRWQMMDESPTDRPLLSCFIKKPERTYIFESERRKALTEELKQKAKQCWNDQEKPYLEEILTTAFWYGDFGGKYWDNKPEELDATIILLHAYGFGSNSYVKEGPNIPTTLKTAFQVMRGSRDGQKLDRFNWIGINGYTGVDTAQRMLRTLQSQFSERKRTINLKDFDVCVISALACGDVLTAVKLIQMAGQFLPTGSDEVSLAITRLTQPGGVFDKAYEIYPEELKDRMDAVLASLGEGEFQELANIRIAMNLKKIAEKRLKEKIRDSRDRWLASQQVARVDLREQQLDNQHLKELIEEATKQGKGWSEIENQIQVRAQRLVDGQIANSIAAELQRRLHPELSIAEKLQRAKKDGTIDYGERNDYDIDLYEFRSSSDMTRDDKERRVKGVYLNNEREVIDFLVDPKKINIKHLVAFLGYPDNFIFQINRAISNYERENRSSDYRIRQIPILKENRRVLVRKLSAGVSFLQSLAENPEMRRILKEEFGFGDLIDPEKLEYAWEGLNQAFGTEILDEASGLNLYESGLSEGQLDLDTQVAAQISEALPAEIEKLTSLKREEAARIADNLVAETKSNLDALTRRQEQLAEPLKQKAEIEARIQSLKQQQVQLEGTKAVGSAIEKILKKGALTQAEKAAKLSLLAVQLDTANQELAAVQKMIDEIGQVDEKEIEALRKRLESLAKLRSAS